MNAKYLYLTIAALLIATLPISAQQSLRISKDEFKDQFLDVINARRAKGCNCGTTYMRPANPLTWNDMLASAAGEHAIDMYRNNYFNHTSTTGQTLQDRLFAAGYSYKGYQSYTIGENIAEGQQTIDEVIAGWFKSVGHCKNLMNPDFNEIGVFEYRHYWVQDFGGRVPLDKNKHYSGRWVIRESK